MTPYAPPETHSETQTESGSAPPSTQTEDLNLLADVLSEIDAILLADLHPQVELRDALPGARARLLRETKWSMSVPPWHKMMNLAPVREPVHQRMIIIKGALNLKGFLTTCLRKRNAMLAQAVRVKVTPECEQCVQGKGQFVGCVVVPDMLEGSCANCVWEKLRSQKSQCNFLVEKENSEDALKHEKKMRNRGGRPSFGMWNLPMWKLPKSQLMLALYGKIC